MAVYRSPAEKRPSAVKGLAAAAVVAFFATAAAALWKQWHNDDEGDKVKGPNLYESGGYDWVAGYG